MSKALIERYGARAAQALEHWLPAPDIHPAILHQAMRYAVLDGGKRLRPILVYATGTALGVPLEILDGPACAVEFIHAYSLVHDDLPAMDNDELRRGKPTCHKAFGEATALLVGDALQTLAFQVLSQDNAMIQDPSARLKLIATLAQAAGSRGMAGGQAIDLMAVGKELNLAELEDMHIHKTGALIRASVLMGALSRTDVAQRTLDDLDHYAKRIGLAFQIRDDILDVTADAETLGKRPGGDAQAHKPTYPTLLGLENARERVQKLCDEARDYLVDFDEAADTLRWMAAYIAESSR
ncbi:MAG: (2E,6E)-farnesyl diphosphate synthase [Gammaproteobacteria bacterium]|nr:(2E,6E)-farnesyl diphosphate synthase [Gammaproteobacteria bacterium]MCP5458789.1 (2E,6E)-farnesyl diphosphate synthase [Gammaproteobacteria bacterium]